MFARVAGFPLASRLKTVVDELFCVPSASNKPAAANGMVFPQLITPVRLQPGGIKITMQLAGLPIEVQIADRIRREMLLAFPAKGGDLKIQVPGGFLISEHAVIILLILIFIVIRGIESARGQNAISHHRGAICRIGWRRGS